MEKKDTCFIKPKAAWKKLNAAQPLGITVYLYGVTGYGKTTLVRHYLEDYRYTWYTCSNGKLREQERKLRKNKKQLEIIDEFGNTLNAVVIDDLQFLKNPEDRERILSIVKDENNWTILISRSPVLPWLKTVYMNQGMKLIAEEDLSWDEKDIGAFYQKSAGIELTEQQRQEVHDRSKGNPLSIRANCKTCEEHGRYAADYLEQSRHDFEDYIIEQIMQDWDMPLIEFLMKMSFLESFDASMAEMVTGNTNAYHLLQQALTIGNFMVQEGEERYRFRPILRTALQKRARNTYDGEEIRDIYYNTGLFYEMQDDIPNALQMYEISGNRSRIREILIRNARRNPGNGHYFELRKYYLSLTKEQIEHDVVLMAGMSMLHSLLLEPEESDVWYDRLMKYAENTGGAERKEAKSRIAYLDIALPHRGIGGVREMIQSAPALLLDHGISFPEFSVTSNLPSVMNGGKDFCEWSKKDKELAATLGKIVPLVLGRYGKGLADIAVGESQYEKGGDDYEIISLLNKGTMRAEAGGTIEIIYAACGVSVRLNLLHGNEDAAWQILDDFKGKAQKESAKEILKNLEAQKCRIALLKGNREQIEEWMAASPREDEEFYILERYRYLTKVRCYIFLNEDYRALALLERLRYYAELYERTYMQMEIKLLLAILWHRNGKEEWRESFLQAVKAAEGYGFYRIISEEGQAARELLEDKAMKKLLQEECDRKYLARRTEETHGMASLWQRSCRWTEETPPTILRIRQTITAF